MRYDRLVEVMRMLAEGQRHISCVVHSGNGLGEKSLA